MLPLIVVVALALFFTVGSSLGLITCVVIAVVAVVALNIALSRLLDRGLNSMLGMESKETSIGKQLAGIGVSLAILGILRWSDAPAAPPPKPAGESVTLQVAGSPQTFTGAYAEHSAFIGKNWMFQVDADSDSEGGQTLSFGFFCDQPRPEDLKGQTLSADYSEHNPDRHLMEECWNYFRANGKYYQGHDVRLAVTEVTEKSVTLTVEGDYLEFASDDDPGDEEGNPTLQGSPVKVSGTFTIPLVREKPEE